MKETTKVTINSEALAALIGVKRGGTVRVECKHGVPVTREWRNRFRDARVDGCVSLAQNNGKKIVKTTKESS